jgi:hypothetical protein
MVKKRLPALKAALVRRGAAPWLAFALLPVLTLALAACSGSGATTVANVDSTDEEFCVIAAPADATPADATPPRDGEIAPDFTGVDVVTGRTVSLSQYEGTTVLLNFVNYGCSSSLNQIVSDQILTIKTLSDQRGDFVPLSVFCGCCPPDVLRDFAEQNGLTWPWILDTDNTIVRLYYDYLSQYGYPTLVLIDKGQLVSGVAGYTDLDTLDAMIGGLSSY